MMIHHVRAILKTLHLAAMEKADIMALNFFVQTVEPHTQQGDTDKRR